MEPFKQPVYITRPFLPPLSEFSKGLEEIWNNRWLTNDGPILKRFEKKLEKFYNTENVCIFNNGTLALQIGLQALGISGEVITTPFTFVATTHALYWNKIRPVFCDIEEEYFTINPDNIEALITPWTSAILAVHVFGNPCKLEKLQKIAHKYNIALIYDAAHAFGVEVAGQPISQFGDMSMFSFHATKIFHTFEGGMLIFDDTGIKKKLNYLKNFGFENEVEVVMPGTNAKMTEVQALMGIQLLKYIDKIIDERKTLADIYRERLSEINGIKMMPEMPGVSQNYSYMPICVQKEFGISRDTLYQKLKTFNIFSRRYFYPLLCDYPCYKSIGLSDPLKVSRRVSSEILTLPIYNDLIPDDVNKICDIIEYISKQ